MGAHLHRRKVEVRWIMLEEDSKPTWTIRPHATPGNDASQGDGLAVLLLQGLQAGWVSPGILAGQVAHLQALDPYRHGVGVLGVVRLARQDRIHLFPHTAIERATSSDNVPEVVLIAGLTDDFEVFSALSPPRSRLGRVKTDQNSCPVKRTIRRFAVKILDNQVLQRVGERLQPAK
jgi:hypothetical protein